MPKTKKKSWKKLQAEDRQRKVGKPVQVITTENISPKPSSELKRNTSEKSSGKDHDKPTSEVKNNTSLKGSVKDHDRPTSEQKSTKSQKSNRKDHDKPSSELKNNTSEKSCEKDDDKPTSELKINKSQQSSRNENYKIASEPTSNESLKTCRKDNDKPASELKSDKSQKRSARDNDKLTSEQKKQKNDVSGRPVQVTPEGSESPITCIKNTLIVDRSNKSPKRSGKHMPKPRKRISNVSASNSYSMQSAVRESKILEEKCFIHAKCCPQRPQHYKHVLGTFHQGNNKYSAESRDNQCVCIDWNTLFYSTLKSASTWQGNDIDSLLDTGDKMYRDLGFIGYPYLEDLPKEVIFHDKHYTINVLETYTGGLCSANSSDGIFYALSDSLDLCFTARRHAIMICKDNAIAVFKDNFGYYILDSHARSLQGIIDPDGTSVLLMFNTLRDLHKGILRLFKSIASLHCETPYSSTELEIYTSAEQYNIKNKSLVQKYFEKQAKMKDQKITRDKEGQKEKGEKYLTAAAMRKRRSRQNSNYRAREQEYNTARRKIKREDSAIREAEQECDTARKKEKRTDPAIRAAEQEGDTARRKEKRIDPAIKEAEQEYNTARRKEKRTDPAIKEAEQEYYTTRRKEKRTDPAIKEAEQEYSTARRKEKRTDPAIKEAEQEYNTARRKEKRTNPAIREAEQECDTARREKKRTDPAIKEAEQEYNTARRKIKREDSAIREAEQECDTARKKEKRTDPAIRKAEQECDTARRTEKRTDPTIREAEQEYNTARKKNVCRMLRFSKSAAERLQDFRTSVENGCIFICVCCNRRCFDTNVVEYNEQFTASIEEDYPDLLERCVQSLSGSDSVQGKQCICHICKNYLKRGKMPPMSTRNGLDIVDLKDSKRNKLELSELEATLIAKNIIFMKIFHLPKSRWSAVKDKTVNVPIQGDAVLQTVSNFPRMPCEAGIIPVKLKRKTT